MYSQETMWKALSAATENLVLALATQQSPRNSELEEQNKNSVLEYPLWLRNWTSRKLQQKLMWKLVSLITFTLIYKRFLKQM